MRDSHHGCDPFSSMHSTVIQDCRLSWAGVAPQVNSEEIPAFVGCARGNQFRVVREQSLQVFKVLDVFIICVVRIEPRKIVGLSLPRALRSRLLENGLSKICMEDGTP